MFNEDIVHISNPMESQLAQPVELFCINYVMLNERIDDISCMYIGDSDCLEF